MPLDALDQPRAEAVREQAVTQLAQLGSVAAGWAVTVEVEPVASAIVRVAQATAPSLIVLGHTRHALLDRLFGTATALQVMRLAHVPVFAVPAESRELPRSAVAAMDLSEFGRDAAQTAADLLGRPASLRSRKYPNSIISPPRVLRRQRGSPFVEPARTSGAEAHIAAAVRGLEDVPAVQVR
jgi:hypothetical protein